MKDTQENLYRRGQFLLGPPEFAKHDGWSTQNINHNIVVCAHPDVPVCHVTDSGRSLTLIGQLLDPRHPADTNTQVLEKLCRNTWSNGDLAGFPRLTDPYCGRWIIIAASGDRAIIVHDAAGQRQVHYAHQSDITYCASQAGPIADFLGLSPDPEAEQFLELCRNEMGEHFHHQFWWPGDTTLFKQVKRLLANHFLDFSTGKSHRFFGQEEFKKSSIEQIVSDACKLFQGSMTAIKNRHPMILACTAGWDSRLLMAASWSARKDIFYYTNRRYGWPLRHPDLAVPGKLLSGNGLKHHIINIRPPMSEEFAEIYRKNVDTPHDAWGVKAEAELKSLPQGAIILSGTVSEVCRRFFWNRAPVPDITPELLAQLTKEKTALCDTPFAMKAFAQWLEKAQFKSLHTLDMFYWEHRAGGWAATSRDELAISHERISLYNCRELLKLMLSADESYREAPDYPLYRMIIEKLWPEGLTEPVNPPMAPPSFTEKVLNSSIKAIRRLVPDKLVSYIKQWEKIITTKVHI